MEIKKALTASRSYSTRPQAGLSSPLDTVALSGVAPSTAQGPVPARIAEIDRRLAAGGITGRERVLLTGERNRVLAESNRSLNPDFAPGPALVFCEHSERSLRTLESATGRVGPVQNLHGLVEAGCTPELSTGQRLRQAATEPPGPSWAEPQAGSGQAAAQGTRRLAEPSGISR